MKSALELNRNQVYAAKIPIPKYDVKQLIFKDTRPVWVILVAASFLILSVGNIILFFNTAIYS